MDAATKRNQVGIPVHQQTCALAAFLTHYKTSSYARRRFSQKHSNIGGEEAQHTCCTVRASIASARGPILEAAARLTMGVSSLHNSLNSPQSSCVVAVSVVKRGHAVANNPQTLTLFVNHSPFFSLYTPQSHVDHDEVIGMICMCAA
jgi:hypothetical protein